MARAPAAQSALVVAPTGSGTVMTDEVRGLAAAPDLTIAETLLDRRIIAGLRNVYECKICFLRGLGPHGRVREIDDLKGKRRWAPVGPRPIR